MPYVEDDVRHALEMGASMETPGELNFKITMLIREYQQERSLSYQTINDILGALEGAKLEFYRRVAVPYENAKMAENGDVYDAN